MENTEVAGLREWAPLSEVFEKIPARVAKGIFPVDLNITCVDVVAEFIALGSDAGLVFWYNRDNGEVQKLRSEISSPITCIQIVSSVEYMVSAGCANGQVNIFQIQKPHPPDLDLLAPLTKPKPIQRYTIRDLHQCEVTCCEWSKNGMRLFSGDKQGVVVYTEFDYQTHLSKSQEILNEAYGIVQLKFDQPHLLVSTIYRTIICQKTSTGKWTVSQVGKKDRKVLSTFGATFIKQKIPNSSRKVICSRPGLRFWIADTSGNVEQTLLFKEAIQLYPNWEVPLLNPSRNPNKSNSNFGVVLMYLDRFAVTSDESCLYILNLELMRVEAVATGFRQILDFCICGKEIIVLEGPRSLVRLAPCPEPSRSNAKIIFNPLLPPPVPPVVSTSPIEYEAESEEVISAEECFESQPSKITDLDSPRTQKIKRMGIFNEIAKMEFDDSILFHTGRAKKVASTKKKKSPSSAGGIVEIGQVTETDESVKKKSEMRLELTTRPTSLDASFCGDNVPILPDPMSPNTLQRILEPKEKALAEELNLIKLEEISHSEFQESKIQDQQDTKPVWHYPKTYPLPKLEDAEVQTTPRKKLHFINDSTENIHSPSCEHRQPLKFIPSQPVEPSTSSPLSQLTPQEVVDLPAIFKIPPLWNDGLAAVDPGPETSESGTSSEWEFVTN